MRRVRGQPTVRNSNFRSLTLTLSHREREFSFWPLRFRCTRLAQPKRHGMDCQIKSGNDEEKRGCDCTP